MRILLDENLPVKVKYDCEEYQVKLGWNGKKNGELLGLAVFEGFKILSHSTKVKKTSRI